MDNNQIQLDNFNLQNFKHIINESLKTSSSLMLEIDNDLVKSLSVSPTQTLLKVTYSKLKYFGENYNINKQFNFYVLNGDLFKKYLDLFSSETANVKINILQDEDLNWVASDISIAGQTKLNTEMKALFNFTKGEFMTLSKVTNYNQFIDKIIKNIYDTDFLLDENQYIEIKNISEKMKNVVNDNTSYLTFEFDSNKLKVNDKMFNLELGTNGKGNSEFKILRSDFNLWLPHKWKIYINKNENEIKLVTALTKEIMIGIINQKTNTATELSNDIEDEDDDFGIENLADYEGI